MWVFFGYLGMVSVQNPFRIYLLTNILTHCTILMDPLCRNIISHMCEQISSTSKSSIFALLQGSCGCNMECVLNMELIVLSCTRLLQYLRKSTYSHHMRILYQKLFWLFWIHFIGTVSNTYFSQSLAISRRSWYLLPNRSPIAINNSQFL